MKKCRKLNSILAAATLCAVSAGASVALAQQASTDQPLPKECATTTTTTTTTPDQSQIVSKCSQLIGTPVENQQGQKLGKIADVVVSFDNQKVSYCVLSTRHGFFGRSRLLPVPLAAFQPSRDGTHLILNASRANLAKARSYDRNEWPSAMTSAWGAEPSAPSQLPPVVVFAPDVTPPSPTTPSATAYPWIADPPMGPPPAYQSRSASAAFDALYFQLSFGDPAMSH
jgi:hypothetical protein